MKHRLMFGILISALLLSTAGAAVPQLINFQGLLTDTMGVPLASDTNSVDFNIYTAAVAGSSRWSETQSVITDGQGRFSVLLGSVSPIQDTVFNQPDRWLGVKVGADPELSPRTQIASVGYSNRVSTVDGATGGVISGNVDIQSDLTVSGKATIGPGNTNTGGSAFVAGENNNASAGFSTVGGGHFNQAGGFRSTVGGGFSNFAGNSSTVGGGESNIANTGTVGGGFNNSAMGGTVAGGNRNFAGTGSFVGGGQNDTASGSGSTISGGSSNTASGGSSTVGGGAGNIASGNWSTIPGGEANTATGPYSLAAGQQAKAGFCSFVWADCQNTDFASTSDRQFLIRAAGGVGIGTNSPSALLHVNGTAGNNTGVWSNLSDRRLKKDIVPIENALATVGQLQPVTFRWNNPKKDEEFGRVRGLIAQDVEEVIPEWIKTDPDGYKRIEPIGIDALLIQAIKEQQKQIEELKLQVLELKNQNQQSRVDN